MSFAEFLTWELTSRDTIDFKKIYVDMVEDVVTGLWVAQFVYWHLPVAETGRSKLTIQRENKWWLAKQHSDWWAEVRLTEKQVQRAVEICEALGIVERRVWKFAGVNTVHLHLVQDAFLDLFAATLARPIEERNNPHTFKKSKRPQIERRPKAKKGVAASADASETGGTPDAKDADQDGENEGGRPGKKYRKVISRNAQRSFLGMPKGHFSKSPKGVSGNAQRALSYTESTAETPPESTSEIPSKTPVVVYSNSEGDARAREDQPEALPGGMQSEVEHTTTENQDELPPAVAALVQAWDDEAAPDGAADADASEDDPLLDALLGEDDLAANADPEPPTDLQKVPPAARAALLAARPVASPEALERLESYFGYDNTTPRLAKYLGDVPEGLRWLTTRSDGPRFERPRELWKRLTLEELCDAKIRADVRHAKQEGAWRTMLADEFDALLGGGRARAVKAASGGGAHLRDLTPTSNAGAYDVKPRSAAPAEDRPAPVRRVPDVGTLLERKTDGARVEIRAKGAHGDRRGFTLSDGAFVSVIDLGLHYRFVDA